MEDTREVKYIMDPKRRGRAKYACAGAVAEDQKRTSWKEDRRRRSGPETPIRPDQQRDRPWVFPEGHRVNSHTCSPTIRTMSTACTATLYPHRSDIRTMILVHKRAQKSGPSSVPTHSPTRACRLEETRTSITSSLDVSYLPWIKYTPAQGKIALCRYVLRRTENELQSNIAASMQPAGTFWNQIVPRGTASTTKWIHVFSSASPSRDGSVLWISQSRKDLFCLSDLSAPYRPSTAQLPPDMEMIHMSACADAVWALDQHGAVLIRTLSKTCPTGMHWTRLDLSQLGPVRLCSLSCGNQHIWACDTSGGIYFRVGTQPLNPSMMLPAWIMIEPPIQPVGIILINVYSGPNDNMLWTLDNKCNVYVRLGITEEMPVGVDWEYVPGLQACHLAVSARTVWALCQNGDIARRYGITEKNAAGDYWKKIPGNMSWVTVTSQDDVWGCEQLGVPAPASHEDVQPPPRHSKVRRHLGAVRLRGRVGDLPNPLRENLQGPDASFRIPVFSAKDPYFNFMN
ncbi:unnamed protein product [Ranitomeya imitator]|uniref:Uncharacterized protein n=1 Tax=Ranitomeya imitator TaxID=111125 RepID=A0ABN9LX57_9NEOB|nr:unnamed protein product [Ranitomeya imitator]